MKKILLALLLVGTVCYSHAQSFTGSYVLVGNSNDVPSLNYNGTDVPNLTEGPLTKVGITSSSSADNFRGTNWPTASAFDPAKYIQFTLTPEAGYRLSLTSVTFGVGRSGTGTTSSQWRSSIDSFASTISTYTTVASGLTNSSGVLTNPDSNSSWTGNVLNLSGASYQNLTSTVTFRLYLGSAEGTTGTAGLQGDLGFAGSLVVIPEPHEYALMLAGLLGLVIVLRRVRSARIEA